MIQFNRALLNRRPTGPEKYWYSRRFLINLFLALSTRLTRLGVRRFRHRRESHGNFHALRYHRASRATLMLFRTFFCDTNKRRKKKFRSRSTSTRAECRVETQSRPVSERHNVARRKNFLSAYKCRSPEDSILVSSGWRMAS